MSTVNKIPNPIVTERKRTFLEYLLKTGACFHSGPGFYSDVQRHHPLASSSANHEILAHLGVFSAEIMKVHESGTLHVFHDKIVFKSASELRPISLFIEFSTVDLGEFSGIKIEDLWLDWSSGSVIPSIRLDGLSIGPWVLLRLLLAKFGILIVPMRILADPRLNDYWPVREALWAIWELRYVQGRGLVDLNEERRTLHFAGLDLERLGFQVARGLKYDVLKVESSLSRGPTEDVSSNAIFIDPMILRSMVTESMDP